MADIYCPYCGFNRTFLVLKFVIEVKEFYAPS